MDVIFDIQCHSPLGRSTFRIFLRLIFDVPSFDVQSFNVQFVRCSVVRCPVVRGQSFNVQSFDVQSFEVRYFNDWASFNLLSVNIIEQLDDFMQETMVLCHRPATQDIAHEDILHSRKYIYCTYFFQAEEFSYNVLHWAQTKEILSHAAARSSDTNLRQKTSICLYMVHGEKKCTRHTGGQFIFKM